MSSEADQQLGIYEPLTPQLAPAQRSVLARAALIQDEDSLLTYWAVLRKRKWTVITAFLLCTVLATLISFRATPIYKAGAAIEVDAEAPAVQSINSDEYRQMPTGTDEDFLLSQIVILKSDSLAWKTIQQLGLDKNPVFLPPARPGVSPQRRKDDLLNAFHAGLAAELTARTRVIAVSFESPDPQLAASTANALVQNYIDSNFQKSYDATQQASKFMEQQLNELKAKVETSQRDLVEYERSHAIVNVSDKQNVLEQRLSDLSHDLTTAQADRIQKESMYSLVKSDSSRVAEVAQNEVMHKLQEHEAELREQLADQLVQFGPSYPKIVKLQKQIDEMQASMAQERKRVIDRIRQDYFAAVSRERLLAGATATAKDELGRLNSQLVDHNILRGEFEANQQLYQRLLTRLKDATISSGLRATNLHLVDAATIPSIPVRPRHLFNIGVGVLVGLLLGVTICFVQESFDHSVRGPEEIESLLSIRALAIVPHSRRGSRRGQPPLRALVRASAGNSRIETICLDDPKSVISEAYRALRTAVLLSTPNSPPQVILVTSSVANEGKTCTATNLAIAMAQRSGPVLLIDGDLRCSGVGYAFHLLHQHKGFSGVLRGVDTIDDALWRHPSLDGLWVMPAGAIPPNPAELLSLEGMSRVFACLRKRFASIVIDSPPLLAVSDALLLSTQCDGVLLVVGAGTVPKRGVVRSGLMLDAVGARVLGMVLNKYEVRNDGYYGPYSGYGYAYHGYCGYGERAATERGAKEREKVV